MRMRKKKGGYYWWKSEIAQFKFFAHHLAVTSCLSVCAPSRLAPGAFLGPTAEVLGDSLILFPLGKTFSRRIHPFFRCVPRLFGLFSTSTPTKRSLFFYFEFGRFVRQESAPLGSVVRWEIGKQTFCFFFFLHFLLVQELFFFSVFFGLIVALSIMSGDLKLCRECVIIEFLWQASSPEEHC